MKLPLLFSGILFIGIIPTVSANNIFGTYDRNDVTINQYRSGAFEIKAKDKSFEIEYNASGAFEIELEKNRHDYQDFEYYASGSYKLDLETEGKQKTYANGNSENTTTYQLLDKATIEQIERDVKAMLTANPIVVKDLKSYLQPLSSVSTLPLPVTPPVVSDIQKQKDALSQKWRNLDSTLAKLDTKKRDEVLSRLIQRIDTMLRNARGDTRILLEYLRELARNTLSNNSIDTLFDDLLKDIDSVR